MSGGAGYALAGDPRADLTLGALTVVAGLEAQRSACAEMRATSAVSADTSQPIARSVVRDVQASAARGATLLHPMPSTRR